MASDIVNYAIVRAAANRIINGVHSSSENDEARRRDELLVAQAFVELLGVRDVNRVELRTHGSMMNPAADIGLSFIEVYW